MHRLKASDLWRMTFAELGKWMWGVGPSKWCVLGLSGKVKKKLYQEFTGLTTREIMDITTYHEIGISIDISLQKGDTKYYVRLIYYKSNNSGYELKKAKLFQPSTSGLNGIDFSIDLPDKTIIGKCLRSMIK